VRRAGGVLSIARHACRNADTRPIPQRVGIADLPNVLGTVLALRSGVTTFVLGEGRGVIEDPTRRAGRLRPWLKAGADSGSKVCEQHHDRPRLGPIGLAENRRCRLPGDNVVRGVEGGVDPTTPGISVPVFHC